MVGEFVLSARDPWAGAGGLLGSAHTWAPRHHSVDKSRRVQACDVGNLEAKACILARVLSPNLWVTLGTNWPGGVLTRKAQCQSPAACFTLEPVM